jgi:translocator protein
MHTPTHPEAATTDAENSQAAWSPYVESLAADARRPSARRRVGAGLLFGALCAGAAIVGTMAMRGRGRPEGLWFRSLRKPRAYPPNWVFGPAWTVLYGLIAYSGYRVWRSPSSRARSAALSLWGAQLVLNGAWTPLFFGARRPRLALADIVTLDASVAAYTMVAARADARASAAFAPYAVWLAYASYLNAGIVADNPRFLLRR